MAAITPNRARNQNPVNQPAPDSARAIPTQGLINPCDAERNGRIFRLHQNAARMRDQAASRTRHELPPDMIEQAGRVFRTQRALHQLRGPAAKDPSLVAPNAGVTLRPRS